MVKPKIELEGIWECGDVLRIGGFPCSTGVAELYLQEAWRKGGNAEDRLRFTRILHDGALVREFDNVANRYTLCFDAGREQRVPKKDPK